MTMATAVPSKAMDQFVVKRIMVFLTEIACVRGDVIEKSHQEPAMEKPPDEIGKMRAAEGGGRWVVEHSPVEASASNGVVERERERSTRCRYW